MEQMKQRLCAVYDAFYQVGDFPKSLPESLLQGGWMVDWRNGPEGQEGSHRQGRHDLRMLLLLAFCLAVMTFPVLCLFNILCFFLSLNRGNLPVAWAMTVASPRNGLDCWVDSNVLLSTFGLP